MFNQVGGQWRLLITVLADLKDHIYTKKYVHIACGLSAALTANCRNVQAHCPAWKDQNNVLRASISKFEYEKYCGAADFVAKCKSGKISFNRNPLKICSASDPVVLWFRVPDG